MSSDNSKKTLAGIICASVIVLSFAITSVILAIIYPDSCDYEDIMGLTISQYLLGLGIANIIVCIMYILFGVIVYCVPSLEKTAALCISIIHGLNSVFGFAWFIVGAVILFRQRPCKISDEIIMGHNCTEGIMVSNIDCIHRNSVHVIYALVLWVFSAFHFLADICRTKSKHSN
jgi:MFS family permease